MMLGLRRLKSGVWNKPPVLTVARRILLKGLVGRYSEKRLGDMAEFVNGTSYDRGLLVSDGMPIIRISNISDPASEYLTTSEEFDNRYYVAPGDLLVSWSASFKSTIWPGPSGVLNQHIFKVTEKSGFSRSFIRHMIEAVFDEMQQKVVGIGMMHLRRHDFLGHSVPAPPMLVQQAVARYLDWLEERNAGDEPSLPGELAEQRRIVAKIDQLAAKIDEARGLRERAFTETCGLTRSVTTLIFDNLRTVHRVAIGNLGENRTNPVQTGPFGAQLHASEFVDEGVPVLNVGNVWPEGLRLGSVDHVLPTKAEKLNRYSLRTGDLLFARSGATLGKVCVVPESCEGWLMSGHLFRVRFDSSRCLPEFAFVALRGARSVREQVFAQVRGATRPGFNTSLLSRVELPLIPVAEQRRLVAYLDDLQAKVDRLKALQAQTAAELDALLPAILDRAFKGEL